MTLEVRSGTSLPSANVESPTAKQTCLNMLQDWSYTPTLPTSRSCFLHHFVAEQADAPLARLTVLPGDGGYSLQGRSCTLNEHVRIFDDEATKDFGCLVLYCRLKHKNDFISYSIPGSIGSKPDLEV